MGQQQLLLIILGVIIVGIAIAVGLSLFSAQSVQANKDAMINDINNLAAYCYQFKIRPTSMGGGNQFYNLTTLPSKLASNSNATYALSGGGAAATTITITGTSTTTANGSISALLNANGVPTFNFSAFVQ
jgi:hypothetical protein